MNLKAKKEYTPVIKMFPLKANKTPIHKLTGRSVNVPFGDCLTSDSFGYFSSRGTKSGERAVC